MSQDNGPPQAWGRFHSLPLSAMRGGMWGAAASAGSSSDSSPSSACSINDTSSESEFSDEEAQAAPHIVVHDACDDYSDDDLSDVEVLPPTAVRPVSHVSAASPHSARIAKLGSSSGSIRTSASGPLRSSSTKGSNSSIALSERSHGSRTSALLDVSDGDLTATDDDEEQTGGSTAEMKLCLSQARAVRGLSPHSARTGSEALPPVSPSRPFLRQHLDSQKTSNLKNKRPNLSIVTANVSARSPLAGGPRSAHPHLPPHPSPSYPASGRGSRWRAKGLLGRPGGLLESPRKRAERQAKTDFSAAVATTLEARSGAVVDDSQQTGQGGRRFRLETGSGYDSDESELFSPMTPATPCSPMRRVAPALQRWNSTKPATNKKAFTPASAGRRRPTALLRASSVASGSSAYRTARGRGTSEASGDAAIPFTPPPQRRVVRTPTMETHGKWKRTRQGPRKVLTDKTTYIMGKTIGRGSFGKIKLVQSQATRKEYAMKIMSVRQLISQRGGGMLSRLSRAGSGTEHPAVLQVQREVSIMKRLAHPNVVQCYEVIHDKQRNYLFVVMDYAKHGPVLKGDPSSWSPISEPDIWRYFRDLIAGLEYLHEREKVLHRDLKPGNLLVNSDQSLMICDFGESQSLEQNEQMRGGVGSVHFMAPEVCRGDDNIGRPSDVWSAGMCLYTFIYGRLAFGSIHELQLMDLIGSGDANIEFPEIIGGDDECKVNPQLLDLLKAMLERDADKRITVAAIKSHPWVTHGGEWPLDELKDANIVDKRSDDLQKSWIAMVRVFSKFKRKLQRIRGQPLSPAPSFLRSPTASSQSSQPPHLDVTSPRSGVDSLDCSPVSSPSAAGSPLPRDDLALSPYRPPDNTSSRSIMAAAKTRLFSSPTHSPHSSSGGASIGTVARSRVAVLNPTSASSMFFRSPRKGKLPSVVSVGSVASSSSDADADADLDRPPSPVSVVSVAAARDFSLSSVSSALDAGSSAPPPVRSTTEPGALTSGRALARLPLGGSGLGHSVGMERRVSPIPAAATHEESRESLVSVRSQPAPVVNSQPRAAWLPRSVSDGTGGTTALSVEPHPQATQPVASRAPSTVLGSSSSVDSNHSGSAPLLVCSDDVMVSSVDDADDEPKKLGGVAGGSSPLGAAAVQSNHGLPNDTTHGAGQ